MAQPFDPSSLPDPQSYMFHTPYGSYQTPLGYQAAANRRETAAPFLAQQYGLNQTELQQKQAETQEFIGPEAVAQRSAKRRSETAESEQSIVSAPFKGASDRAEWAKKTALAPLETDRDRATIYNAMTMAKDQPRLDYLAMAGAQRDRMNKAKGPFEEKAVLDEVNQQWQKKYPDQPIPNYGTQAHKQFFDHAYDAMVHTAQHEQDMAKGEQSQTGQTKREGMSQTGQTVRKEAELASARSPEAMANWGREQLRRKDLKSAERTSIETQIDQAHDAIAEAETNRQYKPIDATTPMLLGITAQDIARQRGLSPQDTAKMVEDALPAYQRARDARKAELLKARGFTMTHLRNKYPDMSDAAIRAAAKTAKIPIVE